MASLSLLASVLRCGSCRFSAFYFVSFEIALLYGGRTDWSWIPLGFVFWLLHCLAIELLNRYSDRREDQINRPERTQICERIGFDAIKAIAAAAWIVLAVVYVIWLWLEPNFVLSALEALIEEQRPDVVVSDIRMPPTSTDEGVQVATRLRAERPEVGVVLLSQHAEVAYALPLLEGGSGGRAYLLKERVADVGELTAAIRAVAAGGSVVDQTVVEKLVQANLGGRESRLDALTPRELEVLAEMAKGGSNATIAGTLFLSERAVEKHTSAIFAKLGLSEERDLNRRVAAVLVYLSDGQGG